MISKNVGRTMFGCLLSCFVFAMPLSFAAPPDFAPPVAANVDITTPENTPKQVTFSASDIHLIGAFTYAVKSSPAHGQVGVVAGDHVTYTPSNGFVGPDSFTYSASDNDGESQPATVTISVVAAPAATIASLPALTTWAAAVLIIMLAAFGIRLHRKES